MFKDAANWTAMKLDYARWIEEEQLEVVVAFLSGSDAFVILPTGFAFKVLVETEEKPIVVVDTPLWRIR